MFATKLRKETAFSFVLITVMLFNALSPVSVSAESSNNTQSTNAEEITSGLTMGSRKLLIEEENLILSEQIAQLAQQQQEEKPVKLKVWAEPSIYTPGKPIRLYWKVENLASNDLQNAMIVIHAPEGVSSADPDITYTLDGLVTFPLQDKKDVSTWNVADDAELPAYFAFDLLVNDDLIRSESVLIDQAHFSVEKNKGGKFSGMDGKVEVEVPANAITESLNFDIRHPSPNAQPGVALTWEPLEIIAVGKDSQKNVDHFKNPIKIKVKYDEAQIFDWDETALTLYYYDPDLLDWFPIETVVDTENNTLTAFSDHLTVFDYKANNWQSQSLPTVDSFKVSDFTGAATYSVNLWTPPGPNGLKPSLALTYNSQVIDESSAFSQPSWLGMGWDLDTGAINRNMHGTDADTSDDTFSISAGGVSGQLLPISVIGNITTYNTADQSFMKVQFDSATNKWTAWGTDGTQYEFANIARTSSTDSDGCATAAQLNVVWRWSLTKITDTHNNQLGFTYDVEKKSASCYNEIAVYPLSISYPNGKYSVTFVTEPRTDYQTSWTTSSSKTLYGTKRLKEVKVQHMGATVRRYALSYAPNTETTNIIYPNFRWSNSSSKTLTLVGVQEFGDDTTQYSLPPVSFTYGDNMHVTNVNNGEGGQVQMTYERWTYFDDINKDLRSLKTTFGAANDECYGGGAIPTSWVRVGTTGTVRCDGGVSYLQVGTTTNVYSVAERPLPEHMVKPGGRYLFFINVRAISNTTTTNWGMRDTGTNQVRMLYSTNYPPTPISTTGGGKEDSLEMPATYNPSTTKLRLECGRCFYRSFEFIQYPLIFRVTQQTVTVQPTGTVSTYSYNYDNAAPASDDNSAAVKTGGTLYTKKLREFRGHAMSQVVNPEGLATVNWFYQTDSLRGRPYDTLTMKRDVFESLDSTDIDWTQSGGTLSFGGIYNIHFDSAANLTNSSANWNVSYSRTPTLTSGEIAVAHVRLTGASAQGDVGLSSGGQFLGITLSNTAVASNGVTLLTSGNMLKDEWYGVMFILDANNGSRIRIWQLDNPANFGETVVSGVGSGTWGFRGRVNNGTIMLDSYFEGTPYSETITRYTTTVQYDVTAVNNLIPSSTVFQDLQVVWNKVASVEQRQYNGDAMFVGTKKELLEYDSYGNVVRQQEYAGNNGTWTLYRGSKMEYATPNITTNVVSLPGRQVTLDCTSGTCDFTTLSNKVSETYLFYDNNTSYTAMPTKGDLTRQRNWVKDSDYSQIDFTYYANGNQKDQIAYTGYASATANPTTGSTQTTTTEYNDGGYNTYATKVTNALGQFTQTGYDFSLGLPTSETDANNVVTQAAYDKFGRMTKVAAPGDSLDVPTLAIEYIKYSSATNQPFQINLTQRVNDTATIQLSRFYDGAGRQIQTQTVSMLVNDTPKNVVVDYQYDSAGKLVKQSIPWARTNGTPVFLTQDFSQSTVTTYDIIGRTLSVTQPNANQVLYTYTDLTTTFIDAKLQSTTKTMDSWGRVVRVDSPTGPAIGYIFDVKGQLLKAIRGTSAQVGSCLTNPTTNCPDDKTVSIVYDAGGHKLSMTDPDTGHWVYEYDALGNLKFQIDNRMCEASRNYDALNRLISKSSTGINCVNQIANSYFYDNDNPDTPLVYDPPVTGNTQVGRRTAMYDNSGSTTWVYDNRGRLTTETNTITGAASPFITQWSEYNSADLPVKMVYPDGEELTYGYNSDGTLDSVISSTGGTYLAETKYDEAGRIKSMEYGQGIIQKSFAYFPFNAAVQGGLLDTAVATRVSDSSTLQDFHYTYDKNANVLTIVDNLAGPQTQTFDYDSLNRLTSASVTGGIDGLYNESYQYDTDTGNLSVKADVSYTYGTDHPHAVASLSNGNSYDYDANGNMIQRVVDATTFDISYDAENRLMGVTAQNVEGLSVFSANPPVYQSIDNGIVAESLSESVESLTTPVIINVPSQITATPTFVPTVTATPIPTNTLPTIDFTDKTATPTPTETLVPLDTSGSTTDAENSLDSQELTDDSRSLEENPTGSDIQSPAPEQAAAVLASASYYVNIATGNNSNDCTSPVAPCRNIQETINKAASGDIIYVASGRYLFSVNGTPNVVIINGKNLTLSGGWNADFSAQNGASTIDGANVNNGILIISGTVVVENFIVENSTSSNSGAIYIVNGNLTVRRSTLRNNVATNNGAGIFVDNGIVTIINSTISGNRATNGGGVYASLKSGASVTIQNSTIAYNQAATGGGIYRATNGTYAITNSIIANNTGTTASPDCSGTIDTANFNVIENTTGCTITNGGNNFYVDPQISSTSSGTMLVYQPLAGSPVINTGTSTGCPNVDEQGTTRPQGSACDIGAVEATVNMPQLGLQVTSNPSSYTTAGQTISYTYTLTNTGNVPLTAPYTVSDNKVASVNCSAATSPLPVGSSTTCTGSYTITQGDVINGSIQSSASATASYSSTTITSNVATATVTVPKLRLQVSAEPGNFTEAGQSIQYTYSLTNTGSVPLNGPFVVTDSKVPLVDCSAATSPLTAGNSSTCVGSYTVTAEDVTAGSIVSSASATASDGINTITSNTIIATISASTGTSALSSAAFSYDGDGKRVKSALSSDVSTITTYFVGNYYEATDSSVTKYYYAGSQRIAMRKGGTLSYILGDHLGSTSIITDASGVIISEIKYKAWGEVRFGSGVTSNAYTYTGQYSYTSDFGLMYYNARWYDPQLGRFAQADSIIPQETQGVQAWDRYAYVNNNPMRFIDPSGHVVPCGGFCSFWGSVSNWWTGNGTGWGHPVRQVMAQVLNLPNKKVNTVPGFLLHSMYHQPAVTLGDKAITAVQNDLAFKEKQDELIAQVQSNPKYLKEAFTDGGNFYQPEFGGNRDPESMGTQLRTITQHPETWKVAANPLTWILRHATVGGRADVAKDGSIDITWTLYDVADLTPKEGRSDDYNKWVTGLGFIYHDLLGASNSMEINATWHYYQP